VSLDHEAERRGDCGWNELGIRQRAQIDKGNGTTETAQQCVRHRNGHGGLAYAAWTDDAHETVRDELLRYGSNSFISTDHPRQWRRQFSGLLAVRRCSRNGQPPRRTRHRRDKTIAATGNVRYVASPFLSAERFPQIAI
jgi:hypothetical protein